MRPAWVYMLLCSDGTYYVGSTTNIELRIIQHELGFFPGYTAGRRPVRLVWVEQFPDIIQAVDTEKKLKKWSYAKKEALTRGAFDAIHWLAECKNHTHFRYMDENR